MNDPRESRFVLAQPGGLRITGPSDGELIDFGEDDGTEEDTAEEDDG